MNHLSEDSYLQFNPETLVEVRKSFGFNKVEDLNKAIDIFEEWVKQQNHFIKKDFSRDYLERCLITAKGSIEVAKTRLDNLCTLKTLIPHFFIQCDLDFNPADNPQVILPKLTKDNGRVFVLKMASNSFNTPFIINLYRLAIMILEYARLHDYFSHLIVIYDVRDMNLADYLKGVDISILRQGVNLLLNGYGARVKALHFLSTSKLIDALVSMVKQLLTAKLSDRIKMHKTLDSLQKDIPKEVLPTEYGGEEKSLYELNDEVSKAINSEDFQQYIDEMRRAGSDESRRQTDKFNDLYMGMPGTFRALSVD